jgi:hypothetical protein
MTTLTDYPKHCNTTPKASQNESQSTNPITIKDFFTKTPANIPLIGRDIFEKIV